MKEPGFLKNSAAIKAELIARARAEGFDALGVTHPDAIPQAAPHLHKWIEQLRHGDMAWMETHALRREHPNALWQDARSVVMFGLNYGPDQDPREILAQRMQGAISIYAQGDDYHELIKGKLKRLGQWLAHKTGEELRVFVDTAPLMEKPLAQAAGLGWQGKHTNLVSRAQGSWFFLGALLTAVTLPFDDAESDHCGSCRACLDACPTNAFPAPYQLDARRCISYLTIEHKGPIPREFRKAMGNRIYGCDDCLAACPWNKFASLSREQKLAARDENRAPALSELAALDDAAFRARFTKSPVKRSGRERFLRNVMIAIGNSASSSLIPDVIARLDDVSPLVRGAAVWAASQLMPAEEFAAVKQARQITERDASVHAEWNAA
ncbi:MAG TPA: tRNA epoxyqueuosine(34) reductase QueG [Xanthobacteraceae bacterium]|nr:tRNA epoxyqueuosine(34) reductase QueG [Xanthobacteraceae bacterium]